MKTSFTTLASLLVGSIGLALTAQAIPITGQINIQTGLVVLVPNQLGAVTVVGASNNGRVTGVEGSYPAALLGDAVSYKAFNVALGAQAIADFWSVSDLLAPVGTGFNYSFDLVSVSSIIQTPTNLFINGMGTLKSSDPLLSPTAGMWSYGINSADGSPTNGFFSFQSNNVARASVADGGSAVILFGLGLLGLGGLARMFKQVGPATLA
ncbi:MAG: hypothetical protein JNL92_00570 [Opitutaceae bacterium]|nr:hypothetical protein [Opitutaceae bacterium]